MERYSREAFEGKEKEIAKLEQEKSDMFEQAHDEALREDKDFEYITKQNKEQNSIEKEEMLGTPLSSEEVATANKVFISEIQEKIKESGSIAELDLNLEGGVVNVSIDRNKSMQELIDTGNYDDYIDPDIAKVFPEIESGPSNLEVAFVKFNKTMTSEEVIAELDKLGLRPVTASELFAIGFTFPELKSKKYLLGLGSSKVSISGDNLPVQCLWDDGKGPGTELYRWSRKWNVNFAFPAVKK